METKNIKTEQKKLEHSTKIWLLQHIDSAEVSALKVILDDEDDELKSSLYDLLQAISKTRSLIVKRLASMKEQTSTASGQR